MGPERPCEVSLASTTRPCARSSGMGVWGAQPPADEGEGQTVRWFRPRGGAAPPRLSRARGSLPLTPALSPQGEGAGRPRGGRRAIRAGGVGAEPPTERKSEGGWVGPALRGIPRVHDTTVRALLRDGGVGGAAPRRRGRGTDREMVPPSRRRCAPAGLGRGRAGVSPSPAPSPRERGPDRPVGSGAQAGRSFRSSEHQQGSGFRTKRGPPHGGPHAWAAKRRNAQGVRTGSCSSSAGGSGSGALAIFSAVTSPST